MRHRLLLWFALTATLPAHATQPVTTEVATALDGTWVLDLAASDDLDALLEAEGVPYLERKLVEGLRVTQVISVTGEGGRDHRPPGVSPPLRGPVALSGPAPPPAAGTPG